MNENEHSKHRDIVKGLYDDYINSGSEALMSMTYQTSFTTISTNTKIKTLPEYHNLLDKILKFCRTCIGEQRYLVGNVGSYGANVRAEYSGDYGSSSKDINYWKYFAPQLEYYNNSDEVDLIAIETVPNKHELEAMFQWNEKRMSKPFYISLSVGDDGNLRDGTTFETISKMYSNRVKNDNLIMMGVNCTNYIMTPSIIKNLHFAIPDLPLVCYSNNGEIFNIDKNKWEQNTKDKLISWGEMVQVLSDNGVRLIGGCCRTTPVDIAMISKKVKEFNK